MPERVFIQISSIIYEEIRTVSGYCYVNVKTGDFFIY